MKDGGHQTQSDKFKSLDERAVRNIVIDRIHFQHMGIGMFVPVRLKILIFPAFQIGAILSFFIGSGKLLRGLAGHFPAQVDVIDACHGKDLLGDIVVKGLFRNAQFRMVMYDLVGGMPLFKKGADYCRHFLRLGDGQVHAFPGIHQIPAVLLICGGRVVIVLVKPALLVVAAAIAGPGGTVPSRTGELQVGRAGHEAVPVERASGIITAFKRHRAFVLQDPVVPDLFAHGGFVFPDRIGDGGFCGTVADPRLDDLSFIKSERLVFV